MTNKTIQSVRKELEKELQTLIDYNSNKKSRKKRIQREKYRLEGFNLGVSLAQKEHYDNCEKDIHWCLCSTIARNQTKEEFLDWLQYIIGEHIDADSSLIIEEEIRNKINELKKSLGVKE